MAQTLKTNQLQFVLDASYRNTNDYGTDPSRFLHSWVHSLTNGTGNNQANFAYADQITIASSSSTTIDMFSLTDRFGNAIAPSKAKLIAVRLYSSSDTSASLNIGAAASNIFAAHLANSNDIIVVPYTGMWIATAPRSGFTIDATNRNLKIANNSATQSVVVDFVLVGVK